MKLFAAGFLSCYLLGAIYTGIMLAHMDFSAPKIAWNAVVWPSLLARLAAAKVTVTHN